MNLRLLFVFVSAGAFTLFAEEQETEIPAKELEQASEEHMRDELGVNEITAPSIAQILGDLSTFVPVSLDLIASNPRDMVFDNRLQTSLHFGSLVADGFMLTIAQRSQDIQDVGRALIRQSRALGVGDRLARRSKSLFEFSEKGDWQGMREELVRTQSDVEKSMLDLRDEEMAHMISLGGWLRGFQLAANNASQNFTPEKGRILARLEIMDYFLDRLDTLHPRLKMTQFVSTLIARITALRSIASEGERRPLTEADIIKMRDLANSIESLVRGPVDADGSIQPSPVAR